MTSSVVTAWVGVMRTASRPSAGPPVRWWSKEERVPLPRHRARGTDRAARGKRRASVAAEIDGRPMALQV